MPFHINERERVARIDGIASVNCLPRRNRIGWRRSEERPGAIEARRGCIGGKSRPNIRVENRWSHSRQLTLLARIVPRIQESGIHLERRSTNDQNADAWLRGEDVVSEATRQSAEVLYFDELWLVEAEASGKGCVNHTDDEQQSQWRGDEPIGRQQRHDQSEIWRGGHYLQIGQTVWAVEQRGSFLKNDAQ